MLPISLSDQSFQYGPITIPYSSVSSAGIGVRNGKHTTHRSLMISYRMPGEDKNRLISFGLGPNVTPLSQQFRERVSDRWKGEAGTFAMRKQLGFKNTFVFTFVAVVVALTVAGVAGFIAFGNKQAPPRLPAPVHSPHR